MFLRLPRLAKVVATGSILLCGIASIDDAVGQAAGGGANPPAAGGGANPPAAGAPSFNAGSLGFGVSLAAVHYTSQNIQNTAIQNGNLLVTSSSSNNIGFGLETHAFIPIKTIDFGNANGPGNLGAGPFIGVQLASNNNTLGLLGFGGMIGIQPDPKSNWSMNLGIGIGYAQIT